MNAEKKIEKKYVETPLMKQYYSIKAVHPDAILLFRVGDFYETFGDDAIKASGIRCVIAASFARIFYRNAINIGLPIVESPEAAREICAGDRLEVDLKRGVIHNLTQSRTYQFGGFPVFIQEMVDAGGLLSYLSQKH